MTRNQFKDIAFAILIVVLRLSEQATTLVYPILAVYCFFGNYNTVKSLLLLWVVTLVNPGIFPEVALSSAGRFLVIGAAGAAVISRFVRNKSRAEGTGVVWVILLSMLVVIHSVAYSVWPAISVLKIVSWCAAFCSLLMAWGSLVQAERKCAESFVFGVLVAVALGSLPLLALDVGYFRNGSGFQGLMNHPQAFGATMAILGAWSLARFLASRRPPYTTLAIALISSMMVYVSEARTGGLALLLGVALSAVLVGPISKLPFRVLLPALASSRVWFILGIALITSLALSNMLAEQVSFFISKSGRANVDSIGSAFLVSRGVLIYPMLDNIQAHPWVGIGFGIGSDSQSMVVLTDPIFGLPISAAIEKGVLPIMMVEELGAPFAAVFAIWFFAMVRRAADAGYVPFAVSITVILVNMGEAVFFSAGGQGLILIIVMAWAATCPNDESRH